MSMQREFGRVVAVDPQPVGSVVAVTTTALDAELVLEDVTDFDEEGGQVLTYWDNAGELTELVLTYTALDDDANTLTLSGAIGQIVAAEEVARVYPPAATHYSAVRLDEDDLEVVLARVPHTLVPLLDPGTRDASEAEAVAIEWNGTEWEVVDVVSAEGQRYVASFSTSYVDETPRIDLVGEDGDRAVIFGYSDHADVPAQISFGELFDAETEAQVNQNVALAAFSPDGSLGTFVILVADNAARNLYLAADEIVLLAGLQSRGFCGMSVFNDNGAAKNFGHGVMYGGVTKLDNVPSSITLSSSGTADAGVVDSVGVVNISDRGFLFFARIGGSTFGTATRHYVTVGN